MEAQLEATLNRLRMHSADEDIDRMVRAIEALVDQHPRDDITRCHRAPDLLGRIADEREEYSTAEVFNGDPPARLIRLLRRIEDDPGLAPEIASVDPAIGSPALALLWQAAIDFGRLRTSGRGKKVTLSVLANGEWQPVGEGTDDWLEVLATDKRCLREIAHEAVSLAKGRRRDWLRQFRNLAHDPTRRRLANILKRDRDEDGLEVAASAIRHAIAKLGLLGGEIPRFGFQS